jgi:hypothetical protein
VTSTWRFIAAMELLLSCTSAASVEPSSQTYSPSPSSISNAVSPSEATPSAAKTLPVGAISVSIQLPGALAAGFDSVWAQDRSDGSLVRIDRDGAIIATIPNVIERQGGTLGELDQTIAVGFGSIWTLARGRVVRIDPSANRVVASISMPDYAASLVAGPDAMWVACCAGGPAGSGLWPRLIRIDPSTNSARVLTRHGTSPISIGVGSGVIWWGNSSSASSVSRLDIATGAETYLQTCTYAKFIVPTRRWIWLIGADGSAERLDPSSDTSNPCVLPPPTKKARIALGVTYADGTIWINDGDLAGFDADTGKVTTRTPVAGHQLWQGVAGVAILEHHAWLVDLAGHRVVRVSL